MNLKEGIAIGCVFFSLTIKLHSALESMRFFVYNYSE